jgi:hypothetical protein
MANRLALGVLLAAAALVSGCGASPTQVPDSASLAPADAVVFAKFATDADSSQWQNAESILERIPGVRDTFVSAIEQELKNEALDWEEDVAPALGDEVVVVVTAKFRPIVLLQPESEEKLDALLAKSDEESVRAEVEGHVALAEKDADLAEYRAALERGTIESDESFAAGLDALPDESLALWWVDLANLTDELKTLVPMQVVPDEFDLGIDWLSASLSAEDDGMLVAIGAHSPGAGDTHYEPELFRNVPADAIAVMSFGGTQDALDRLQGQADLDELSRSVEELTGASLDGIVDALSGEGVFYVRPGETIPEVTLALAPPDPEKTWATVDRLVRKLAQEAQVEVTTTIENGVEVSMLDVEEATIRYARLDGDTIAITSGKDALAMLAGAGPKLVDSEGFLRAAEDVGLDDRTKGFMYVDVDGMLPLIEDAAGESIPPDVREGVAAVDSLVFQTSGDGDTTVVSGFVRVP